MPKVNLRLDTLERACKSAFKETCLVLHREMLTIISENGAFEGFAGDIVDTGDLRSKQQPPQIEETQATFRNASDHAVIVHEGATFRAGESWQVPAHSRTQAKAFGRSISPRQVSVKAHSATRRKGYAVRGRPWMKLAFERTNSKRIFNAILAKKIANRNARQARQGSETP